MKLIFTNIKWNKVSSVDLCAFVLLFVMLCFSTGLFAQCINYANADHLEIELAEQGGEEKGETDQSENEKESKTDDYIHEYFFGTSDDLDQGFIIMASALACPTAYSLILTPPPEFL